jgi:hypothetical protein
MGHRRFLDLLIFEEDESRYHTSDSRYVKLCCATADVFLVRNGGFIANE